MRRQCTHKHGGWSTSLLFIYYCIINTKLTIQRTETRKPDIGGHRQSANTQIKRYRMWLLIRVFTFCLPNVLVKDDKHPRAQKFKTYFFEYNVLLLLTIYLLDILLTIFANSLDPDQVRLNVGPDLDPNCLTL